MSSTPRATVVALVATLAVTAAALVRFLATESNPEAARAYLVLFGGLFAVRVVAQIGVIAFRPAWLPPPGAWNLLPYPLLLPLQLVLIGLIATIIDGRVAPGPDLAHALVVFAFAYWTAMGTRYALRMARRPDQRWFGGAVPIVFHCVLAAFVFVLGVAHLS